MLLKNHARLSPMTLGYATVDQEAQARHLYGPGGGLVEEIEAPQQGRFASARSAEQHREFSLSKINRGGMQSGECAWIHHLDLLQPDHGNPDEQFPRYSEPRT
jgi:hypothetical protein